MPRRGSANPDGESIGEAVAERLADTMFALSRPSRVRILGCLLSGPCSVGDLTTALGMEQSAVSHQLRILREHDLVRAEKVGRNRVYALYDEHVSDLVHAGIHHVDRTARRRRRPTSNEGMGGVG
jgi:ArsR family transcriptional regulator, nickel/cobalt-responsive transcriptional repressor